MFDTEKIGLTLLSANMVLNPLRYTDHVRAKRLLCYDKNPHVIGFIWPEDVYLHQIAEFRILRQQSSEIRFALRAFAVEFRLSLNLFQAILVLKKGSLGVPTKKVFFVGGGGGG